MKVIPVALAAHFALPETTVAAFLKVVRADAAVFGYTSTDQPITVDGQLYEPGLQLSSLASSEGLGVDNLECTVVPDDSGTLTAADLYAGKWDHAAFTVFEANYESPGDGITILKEGNTGELDPGRSQFVIEFRARTQLLQQSQSISTSKTCRARLGDAKCTKDLTAFTDTGAFELVNSGTELYDGSVTRTEDDFFGEGLLTVTSGLAIGQTRKVKSYSYGYARFITFLPFIPAPVIGDTYSVVAGCRHRLAEDCATKFSNVLNFQGEPHVPNLDQVTKPGSAA